MSSGIFKTKTKRNERTTEEIVRAHFREDPSPHLVKEEQISREPRISRALETASKQGKGVGKPEFIYHSPLAPNFVLVVECKADPRQHESPLRNKPKDYAVDGILHYMKFLARQYDVIGVAVSGETPEETTISTFKQLKSEPTATTLNAPNGPVIELKSFDEYVRLLQFDPAVRQRDQNELMKFSRELHNYMRDHAKVSEQEKPLVVSGALLALRDDLFRTSYVNMKGTQLPTQLYEAIERELVSANLPHAKQQNVLQPYSFLVTHPVLKKPLKGKVETPLQEIVRALDEHVRPFVHSYDEIDVIGQFYGEFLRYTGGDKKGLGIVLTPRHCTELVAKMANPSPEDTVIDTCAGTGGFLIAAMVEMDRKAGDNEGKRRRIREQGLVGIEEQPMMFALAASNMILRGDGKANLYNESCFDEKIIDAIRVNNPPTHGRPNIGLINPPFSQKGDDLHEFNFVETMLDNLVPGGTGVVVVPMSCAIEPHPLKKRLLENHTLDAVVSMPDELFYPVGTITCLMVFTAHKPHKTSKRPTWFGYWKQDGFKKIKPFGRIDPENNWQSIRDEWLDNFFNRREIPGHSVLKVVGENDEWCAEAYMETDYSVINEADYAEQVRKYALFKAYSSLGSVPQEDDEESQE